MPMGKRILALLRGGERRKTKPVTFEKVGRRVFEHPKTGIILRDRRKQEQGEK